MRRLHVEQLSVGLIDISESQSHHARNVLRLKVGDELELFDNAGRCAVGSIEQTLPKLLVRIAKIDAATISQRQLTIASAIPKGERAEWMIEKLSELGVSRFVPLLTERSVVQASGTNKLERWRRIATEAAKQSRRAGVMAIDEPTPLATAIAKLSPAIVLSTEPSATPIAAMKFDGSISLFVGPEGGWTDNELAFFTAKKVPDTKLTNTILRVETAAIAAAAILLTQSVPSTDR